MSVTTQPTTPVTHRREPNPTDNRDQRDAAIVDAIRQLLSEDGRCPCAFYFNDVRCECCRGVLKLEGRVPTIGLKKVLLSLIEKLDGITRLDDQLDVISSTGLSQVRPK